MSFRLDPPEPPASAVEMFDLAIAKGEVKIEDEDTVLLERLFDLEAESDMIPLRPRAQFSCSCKC